MSNLSVCQVLQVLTLLVWIRVGIRILREVEGQHFADDAVSLLWTEEKAKQIQLAVNHVYTRSFICFFFLATAKNVVRQFHKNNIRKYHNVIY